MKKTNSKEKTIYSSKYKKLIAAIVKIRHERKLTQRQLAEIMGVPKTYIAYTELCERRLDVQELFDLMTALGVSKKETLTLLDKTF